MLEFYLENLRTENQNYLYNKDYRVGLLRKLKFEIQ